MRTAVQHSGRATVVVMQTAEHGKYNDLSCLRPLPLRWHGNRLANALMWPGVIEEVCVLFDHVVQMALVEDENMVETLAM